MHILVPLKGVEFGHLYDNQPIEGSKEDHLRLIGKQLLGQALWPNFWWETEEEGSAFITKPTASLPSEDGWKRSRQLFEHQAEINFASRTQQELTGNVVAHFVDLPSAITRQKYATRLASIRGHHTVDRLVFERPILLPADELAQK